jgi:hypothetical protein
VIADVAFVPPDCKKYVIQETNGSGLGQILVRRMLANEVEVTKDHVSTDISADNYDFHFLREADASGQRCYVLELLPRRIERHLLHGNIWVDANTYLLRRFEGELALRVPHKIFDSNSSQRFLTEQSMSPDHILQSSQPA